MNFFKLTVFLLCFSSCKIPRSDYTYTQVNIDDSIREEIIYAYSDSIALTEAYNLFFISKELYRTDEFHRKYHSSPKTFILRDYDSLLIDKSILPNKVVESIEKKISTSIKKEIEEKKIKRDKERYDLVQKQFSDWDGSHPELTKIIKQSMLDPSSYEHIETKFKDEGVLIFVITKFRGNNSFGGKTVNTIKAQVDISGDVVNIIE